MEVSRELTHLPNETYTATPFTWLHHGIIKYLEGDGVYIRRRQLFETQKLEIRILELEKRWLEIENDLLKEEKVAPSTITEQALAAASWHDSAPVVD